MKVKALGERVVAPSLCRPSFHATPENPGLPLGNRTVGRRNRLALRHDQAIAVEAPADTGIGGADHQRQAWAICFLSAAGRQPGQHAGVIHASCLSGIAGAEKGKPGAGGEEKDRPMRSRLRKTAEMS